MPSRYRPPPSLQHAFTKVFTPDYLRICAHFCQLLLVVLSAAWLNLAFLYGQLVAHPKSRLWHLAHYSRAKAWERGGSHRELQLELELAAAEAKAARSCPTMCQRPSRPLPASSLRCLLYFLFPTMRRGQKRRAEEEPSTVGLPALPAAAPTAPIPVPGTAARVPQPLLYASHSSSPLTPRPQASSQPRM